MATNPGRLLTKDELMKAIWPDAVVEESNLAYTVFAIRKALGEGPGLGTLSGTLEPTPMCAY